MESADNSEFLGIIQEYCLTTQAWHDTGRYILSAGHDQTVNLVSPFSPKTPSSKQGLLEAVDCTGPTNPACTRAARSALPSLLHQRGSQRPHRLVNLVFFLVKTH